MPPARRETLVRLVWRTGAGTTSSPGPVDGRHRRRPRVQIQIHTDKNVTVSDGMVQRVEADLESALSRFSDQITRIEVHLGDENAGGAGGSDKRCMIEARSAGKQPVAVTHHAASVGEACSGAVHKLAALIGNRQGRSDSYKGGESIRHLEVREGLS
jgi:hypothetical protein